MRRGLDLKTKKQLQNINNFLLIFIRLLLLFNILPLHEQNERLNDSRDHKPRKGIIYEIYLGIIHSPSLN